MGDSVTESKILWLSTKGQEKGVKFELVSFGGVERTQVSIRYSFVYMASLTHCLLLASYPLENSEKHCFSSKLVSKG